MSILDRLISYNILKDLSLSFIIKPKKGNESIQVLKYITFNLNILQSEILPEFLPYLMYFCIK